MNLPEPVCLAFIEHINISYLEYKEAHDDFSLGRVKGYMEFAKKHMENYFSVEWSNGGTIWNGSELEHVDPQDEPSIEELEDFLKLNFPELNLTQTQDILSLVNIMPRYDGDEGGGIIEYLNKNISFETMGSYLSNLYPQISYEDYWNFNELLQEYEPLMKKLTLFDYPKFKFHHRLNQTIEQKKEVGLKIKI